jgi:hypothetical protein
MKKYALPLFFFLLLAACVEQKTFYPADAAYTSDGETPLSCVPNLDGEITADEIDVAIGVSERFMVSPAGQTEAITEVAPAGLEGSVNAEGQRVWNWSTSLASDKDFTLTPTTLAGKWYAASFPDGQFVLPNDPADMTESVYVKNDQAIVVLGFASSEENPPSGKTLFVYDSPVTLYQFPIKVGASWTSSGTAKNATLDGLPFARTDTYATQVDASGMLILPDFTFTQVFRVSTLATFAPEVGPPTSTIRQVSFLFECFGEVARATSQTNEPNADFTVASEIRRIGATPPSSH